LLGWSRRKTEATLKGRLNPVNGLAVTRFPSSGGTEPDRPIERMVRRRGSLTEGGQMADHLDAPRLTSPAMAARVAITDVYAFQTPGDPGRTALILTVNPLAPTLAQEFRADAVYEILVDTDSDAVPDIAFRCRFSPRDGETQVAHVSRAELNGQIEDGHLHGQERPLVEGAKVSFGSDAIVSDGVAKNGVKFFA